MLSFAGTSALQYWIARGKRRLGPVQRSGVRE